MTSVAEKSNKKQSESPAANSILSLTRINLYTHHIAFSNHTINQFNLIISCTTCDKESKTGTEILVKVGGKRKHLVLHYHHQNDFRIKIGSDVSHFNVSLIVQGCPSTLFFKRKVSQIRESNLGPSTY